MITTVVAIYAAAVATVSLLFSWWVFIVSGPKIQVRAELWPPLGEEDDEWSIDLQVWTGRQAVKFDIASVHVLHRFEQGNASDSITLKWDGPDLPMMMPANSFEQWFCGNIDAIAKAEGNSEYMDFWKGVGIDLTGQRELETQVTIDLKVGGKLGQSSLTIPLRPAKEMHKLGFHIQDFWARDSKSPLNSQTDVPILEPADDERPPR